MLIEYYLEIIILNNILTIPPISLKYLHNVYMGIIMVFDILKRM